MLFDSFDHTMQDESAARQSDSVEIERFCILKRPKFVLYLNHMAPKWLPYGMSTNLPRHGPKWNSANYGLEPRNDSVCNFKPLSYCFEETI